MRSDMDKMRRFWVGADPGGKNAFGLVFVDVSRAARCETASSVDEAVRTITAVGKPLGLGIDAPMCWSAGEGADRKTDARLGERYGILGGTIQFLRAISQKTMNKSWKSWGGSPLEHRHGSSTTAALRNCSKRPRMPRESDFEGLAERGETTQ